LGSWGNRLTLALGIAELPWLVFCAGKEDCDKSAVCQEQLQLQLKVKVKVKVKAGSSLWAGDHEMEEARRGADESKSLATGMTCFGLEVESCRLILLRL
jgi:hypothetical protein